MSLCIRPQDTPRFPGGADMSKGLTDGLLVDRKGSRSRAAYVGTHRMKLIRQTYVPGGRHFPHEHATTEQAYYLISGRARVRIGAEVFVVEAGTVFYIPPKTEHEVENIGDEPLVNLLICGDLDESEVA